MGCENERENIANLNSKLSPPLSKRMNARVDYEYVYLIVLDSK